MKRVLLVGLNICIKGRTATAESQEKLKLLFQLTFYLLDKLRRFKLSKEVCHFFYFMLRLFKRNCILHYRYCLGQKQS